MNQTGDKHEALNPPAVADILRSIELRAGYIMSGHGAYAEAEEIKRLCDRAFKGMRAWWHGSDKADSATSATEPKRIDPQYIGASVSGAWVKEWQDRADQLERELAAQYGAECATCGFRYAAHKGHIIPCPRCELAEARANADDWMRRYGSTRGHALPSSTKDAFPLGPTKEMIEAGAQRLVRWEDGSKWPDSWGSMDVRASRNDAERVWRSMWLEAEKNAAPQDSQADRNSSGSQPPEVPADAAAQQSVKLQGDPQNAKMPVNEAFKR